MDKIVRSFVFLFAFACMLAGVMWIFAHAELFKQARIGLFEKRLTQALGIDIVINDDVQISLFPEIAVSAFDIRFPEPASPSRDTVTIDEIRLAVLSNKGVNFPKISGEGVHIHLVVDNDQGYSWYGDETLVNATHRTVVQAVSFFGNRTVSFSDLSLTVENPASGFVYDFELDRIGINRSSPSGTRTFHTKGQMNGQAFEANGEFPEDASFDLSGSVGTLAFRASGKSESISPNGDFTAQLMLQGDDLHSVFEVLRLKADYQGSIALRANVAKRGTLIRLADLDADATLMDGRSAQLTGSIAGNPAEGIASTNIDTHLSLNFTKTGEAVLPALYFGDIRPVSLTTNIVAADNTWTIQNVELDTNAFDKELQHIGPFRIGDIKRTEDGLLALSDFLFSVGTPTHQLATITGDVGDLLNFENYIFEGEIDVVLGDFLPKLPKPSAESLGKLVGGFRIEDVAGKPVVSHFDFSSADTNLWQAALSLDVPDLADLRGMQLTSSLKIPDIANLRKTMQLPKAGSGSVNYSFDAIANERGLQTSVELTTGESDISANLNLKIDRGLPDATGTVSSVHITSKDLQHTVHYAQDLSVFVQRLYEALAVRTVREKSQKLKTPWRDRLKNNLAKTNASQTDVDESSGLESDRLSLVDLMDPLGTIGAGNASIDVSVERISGVHGLNYVDGTLRLNEGVLQFSQLDLAAGRGQGAVSAKIDLVKEPERVHVWGHASGWDLGQLMKETGLHIDATGMVHAKFDISGHYHSAPNFVDTVRGSVTVGLENGRIGTSLLELSGLGVVPWLFSEALAKGASRIACIKAPLHISHGEIKIKDAVMETNRVQVIASGSVDYKRDRISVDVSPRSLGHPLSKSHWPFTISGKLSAPKVKAHYGRTHRSSPQMLAMPTQRSACIPDIRQLRVISAPTR